MGDLSGSDKVGTCESCPKENVKIELCGQIWLCEECKAKEIAAALNHQTPEKQEERLRQHHLELIRKENAALRISTDIFNAKIKAISELEAAINADPNVVEKNYMIAEVILERFRHLNGLIHDIDIQKVEYETEQRALQTFFVEHEKKLRADEREKLKASDITYKPIESVVKKKKEAPPKKWDKTGIAAASIKWNVPEQVLQMICVARDVTVDAAVMIAKEQGIIKS